MRVASVRRARCLGAWLVALLGAVIGSQGLAQVAASPARPACRVEPDARTLQQKLVDVQPAFVGSVRSVDGAGVGFDVELPLRGSPGRTYVAATDGGDCTFAFRIGERWLYAGTSMRDPSRRLGKGSEPLARHIERLDDRRLELQAWQACDDGAQCVAIDNGCLLTAVHGDHRTRAAQRALARGGDPRAMSCEVLALNDTVLACVQRRCGAWRLNAR